MSFELMWGGDSGVTLLLVFLRMSGFFFLFPLFRRPYCPTPVAAFLALLCSLLIAPTLTPLPGPDPALHLVLAGIR
ncbi:MAG: flagellar biosynthetic protein FliR, partial [Bacillota bacterium]